MTPSKDERMTLAEFAIAQEKEVQYRAKRIRLMFKLSLDFALAEKLARRELECIWLFKGISLDEFMAEVFTPGSFSNH